MEFRENNPIYIQIASRISDEILSLKYEAEKRLPSVREYAAFVEVNANTAMRAYEYLQSRGIIYNKRGIGFFVAPEAVEIIAENRKKEFMKIDIKEVFEQMYLLNIDIDEIINMYNQYIIDKQQKK